MRSIQEGLTDAGRQRQIVLHASYDVEIHKQVSLDQQTMHCPHPLFDHCIDRFPMYRFHETPKTARDGPKLRVLIVLEALHKGRPLDTEVWLLVIGVYMPWPLRGPGHPAWRKLPPHLKIKRFFSSPSYRSPQAETILNRMWCSVWRWKGPKMGSCRGEVMMRY
jgi:hypothetical protein